MTAVRPPSACTWHNLPVLRGGSSPNPAGIGHEVPGQFREESATAFEIGYLPLVTINRRSLVADTVTSRRMSRSSNKMHGATGPTGSRPQSIADGARVRETESGVGNAGKRATVI
jgi:hypothetical protein